MPYPPRWSLTQTAGEGRISGRGRPPWGVSVWVVVFFSLYVFIIYCTKFPTQYTLEYMLALFLARLARLEQTRKRAFPRLRGAETRVSALGAARKRAFICRLDKGWLA